MHEKFHQVVELKEQKNVLTHQERWKYKTENLSSQTNSLV
jgi:hypothetical protein